MLTQPTFTIAKREWNSYFNSPVAYVFIVVFLLMMGFFTFNMGYGFFRAGQAELSMSFFRWHPWLYLVLVPATAMGVWAEERRNNTIELLFTLPVTITQAVIGKFLAAWAFLVLALLLTFPIPLTTLYLGDPDMGVVFSGYVGSALLAGSYLALGMWTSAITRNQVVSFILSVVLGLFLVLAGYPPITDFLSKFMAPGLVNVIAGFSFMSHYEAIQRGVIDFRDLFYFACVIGFMLFLTQQTLKAKAAN